MKLRRIVEAYLEREIIEMEIFGNRKYDGSLGYKSDLDKLEKSIEFFELEGHDMRHFRDELKNLEGMVKGV